MTACWIVLGVENLSLEMPVCKAGDKPNDSHAETSTSSSSSSSSSAVNGRDCIFSLGLSAFAFGCCDCFLAADFFSSVLLFCFCSSDFCCSGFFFCFCFFCGSISCSSPSLNPDHSSLFSLGVSSVVLAFLSIDFVGLSEETYRQQSS